MQRTKWLERKFSFDYPERVLPNILERLRGTPARLNEMTLLFNETKAAQKTDNQWSIKEHIGHLSDLEDLHIGRVDDFLTRKEVLRAADMTNAETYRANHNKVGIQQLLDNFTIKRRRLVTLLEGLDGEIQNSRSLHPRLQVMMRPVDMAYFTAEHDDHHLASMRALLDPGN